MPRRRIDRAAMIQDALAGGVQDRDRIQFYPPGWFDDPLYVVTSSHVRIHHRIIDEPIFQDTIALARFMRILAEQSKEKARGTRGYIAASVWLPILEAFGYRCAYCGASGVPLEKDHRIPVSRGGTDDPANLVPACKPCNVRKFNHPPESWPIIVERVQ